MKKVKIKDTDYLFLSSYIHAKEKKLLDSVRLERMLEAKSPEDALKILEECGWPAIDRANMKALERALSKRREEVFTEMHSMAPNPKIVELFRIKYDYHNIKVLMKATATGVDATDLLSESGRIPTKMLREAILEGSFENIPKAVADSFTDASDTLARTGDPQIADFIIDKAYYAEFLALSAETGSRFLEGYVKLSVDIYNLRSAVRVSRMNKNDEFLKNALVPGGNVKPDKILRAYESPKEIPALFKNAELTQVTQEAERVIDGGRLTKFEKLCDEALMEYLSSAKMAGFNEKPLIRYLNAVEAEISAVRTIMTGHFSGIPVQKIKETLREGLA